MKGLCCHAFGGSVLWDIHFMSMVCLKDEEHLLVGNVDQHVEAFLAKSLGCRCPSFTPKTLEHRQQKDGPP